MKKCRICGEHKPLADFHRATGTRDGRRGECKACFRVQWKARYEADPDRRRRAVERAKAWQARNPGKHAEIQQQYRDSGRKAEVMRAAHLKRKYGLTVADYEAMLAAQGGGCAICGAPEPDGQSLHVDHCVFVAWLRCASPGSYSLHSAIGALAARRRTAEPAAADGDRLARAAAYLRSAR